MCVNSESKVREWERERESAEEQYTRDWDMTNFRELGLRNVETVLEIPTTQKKKK